MRTIYPEKLIPYAGVCLALLLSAGCGQEQATEPMADAPKPAAEAMQEPAGEKVVITTSSDEAMTLYMQGRAMQENLHFTDATEAFAAAVAADPGFAMGYYGIAVTSQTPAEFFDAVGMAKANAAGASDGEQLMIAALVAQSENDQAAQLAALKKLVSAYPKDERTHMLLGNFMNGQQDYAEAAKHYGHASKINPNYAVAFNALGYAYRSMEDFDQAKAAFEQYIQLVPDEANPYDSYAELLLESGDYDASIENYRKALELNPNFPASYAGIATNYSMKGDADRAMEAAEQMLAAARNFNERQNAMFQAVLVNLFAGDVDAANAVLKTMAAEAGVRGNHAVIGQIHEYMGDIMLDAGEAAKAEAHFAQALEHVLQADINAAAKAQAERTHLFKTAIASIVADDAETAGARMAEYKTALEAAGTAAEKRRVHELQGYLAMISEDMEGGVKHLEMASQINPVVLYWTAYAHKELGHADQARDLATRAANRNALSPNLPFVRADALKMLDELNAG